MPSSLVRDGIEFQGQLSLEFWVRILATKSCHKIIHDLKVDVF